MFLSEESGPLLINSKVDSRFDIFVITLSYDKSRVAQCVIELFRHPKKKEIRERGRG